MVYKLVNVVMTFVYQCTKCHSQGHNQVIGINICLHVSLPEAICCCLQTCNSRMFSVLVGIPLRQKFHSHN